MSIPITLVSLVFLLLQFGLSAQTVIQTANSGNGSFRVAITDPFGTPTFQSNSANLAGTIWGWKNNGSNETFAMMLHFDITGQEAAINDISKRVILDLGVFGSDFAGTQTATVYFAGASSLEITGNTQGNSILGGSNGFAIPGQGTPIAAGIVEIGVNNEYDRVRIDVSDALRSADLSINKFVYFRLETTTPTVSPGSANSNLGRLYPDLGDLTNELPSTLVIEPVPVSRPNILFCMADDWGGPHAGAYGTTWVRTPHFDRLADEGVLFTNAFTNSPSCTPARGIALTGRLPWRLGTGATLWGTLPASLKTFSDILAANGYRAGTTGKGWGPGDYTAGGRDDTFRPSGPHYNDITLTLAERSVISEGLGQFDYFANFDQFLSQRYTDDPFVFWYGSEAPHRPYEFDSGRLKGGIDPATVEVPSYWPDTTEVRKDIADYAWEVEYSDHHLGLMLSKLEAIGELENTVIIVTGDHGMPHPRIKTNLYEAGIHVPFVVRYGDGISTPARIVDDPISFIDIAPTLLDLAGIQKPDDVTHDGLSLRDLLESNSSGTLTPTTRPYVYLGMERHATSTRDGLPGAGYPSRAIRSSQYLYIRNYEPTWPPPGGEASETTSAVLNTNNTAQQSLYDYTYANRPAEELYDVVNDPECLINLAVNPSYAATKTTLANALEAKQSGTADPRHLGYGERFFSNTYYKGSNGPQTFPGWESVTVSALDTVGSDGLALMSRLHLGADDPSFSEAAYYVGSDQSGPFLRYRIHRAIPEFKTTPQWTSDLENVFDTSSIVVTPMETEGNYQWNEVRPSNPTPNGFFTLETSYEPSFQ